MSSTIIGERYQIVRVIGRGTFGTTFLAIDTQRPGTPQCIVKQFTPVHKEPNTLREAKRLFNLEAEILEKLGKHDQIPQLLAHLEQNGEFYLIQEYIEGHDLSQEILHGQQQSEDFVIQFLHGLLPILAFVHQHNVIHRDIKPSNIRRRLSDGKLVLIDFGAVKEITTQLANLDGQMNATVIGTPGYMPIEQLRRNPQFNSDIYAVGVIAIQSLTGLLPQQLEDPVTGKIIWRHHVKTGDKLADVLDKMVHYEFHQRYQTADEVLLALQQPSTKIESTNKALNTPPKKALIGLGIAASVISVIVLLSQVINLPAINFQLINPKENFASYENAQYGIKLQYPQSWERQDTVNPITGEVVTFLSVRKNGADKFQEKITITVQDFTGTLHESSKSFQKDITQYLSEAKILEESPTTLANNRANKLIFTGKDGEIRLKNLQVWTLKDNKAYIITYTAKIEDYDQFIQTAEKVIKSLEILSGVSG